MQTWSYAQNNQYKFSHLDITNGLSDNQVNCFFRDDKGFMWFGTTSGLNRYDGYKFKVFKHDTNDDNSLEENHVLNIFEGPEKKLWIFSHSTISIYNPSIEKFSNNITDELAHYHILTNQITSVKKDYAGNFWFLTNNRGLYCYDPQNNSTVFYSSSQNSKAVLHSNFIRDIVSTSQNSIWLVYNDGIIDQMDSKSNKIISRYYGIAKAINARPESYNMTIDNRMNLWIYSSAAPIGVFCLNTKNYTLQHFDTDAPENRLNSNIINSVVQADDNKVWIGTDHGGINIFDQLTHKITYLVNREDDSKSLSGNSVFLYKDNGGIIWAGSFMLGYQKLIKGVMHNPTLIIV